MYTCVHVVSRCIVKTEYLIADNHLTDHVISHGTVFKKKKNEKKKPFINMAQTINGRIYMIYEPYETSLFTLFLEHESRYFIQVSCFSLQR